MDVALSAVVDDYTRDVAAASDNEQSEEGAFEYPPAPAPSGAGDSFGDGDDDVPFEIPPEVQTPMLDVQGVLETPPVHHINDTATCGLGEVMQHWDDYIYSSQQICNICRKRGHKSRLISSCFSQGMAVNFQGPILKFKGKIHTKRWATVVFSIPEIYKVETGLTWFWDKRAFQGEDGHQKEDTIKIATDVDQAVQSDQYWAYLRVMERIAKVERKLTEFAELCPCHFMYVLGLDGSMPDDIRESMKHQWSQCPFRGMMVAELAEEFMQLLGRLNTTSSGELLASLPARTSAPDRQTCLLEFEAGRAHLNFVYVMKLGHLHNAPYCVYGIAHYDTAVAWRAGDKLAASRSNHPRVREFQEPAMASQFAMWKDGADICSEPLKDLCEFIAIERFAWSTDRPGEALHARISKMGRACPNHTEQFMSYHQRAPEIEHLLADDPTSLTKLAWCLDQVGNPSRCSQLLGLRSQPTIQQALVGDRAKREVTQFYRSSSHAKVIYHADGWSQYIDTVPDLDFWDCDGGELRPPEASSLDPAPAGAPEQQELRIPWNSLLLLLPASHPPAAGG